MASRLDSTDLEILAELEKKVLWLSSWTIHHANHVRESTDALKVGGHQASSASLATIMTALYFHVLRPHDRVDFSTGSVGLGVAQTLFSSLTQDYVRSHFPTDRPEGRMVALVGDAEMDEGNIFEAMLEGWKHGLRNCWWVIDYNRQSLDAVIREGLWARYEALFRAFGWDVVILKYGSLLEQAFLEPGGGRLRRVLGSGPHQLYSALVFQGGPAWRKH